MAYLTNTVYVQSLDDIEAMDLHSRYTELLKVRHTMCAESAHTLGLLTSAAQKTVPGPWSSARPRVLALAS